MLALQRAKSVQVQRLLAPVQGMPSSVAKSGQVQRVLAPVQGVPSSVPQRGCALSVPQRGCALQKKKKKRPRRKLAPGPKLTSLLRVLAQQV